MKQIVLLALMLAAALIAACSAGDRTVGLTGNNPAPVSLEKLASEDILNELKVELEKSNANVPAIIAAVRSKFGIRNTNGKDLMERNSEVIVQEKATNDVSRIIDFAVLDSVTNPRLPVTVENDEKIIKQVCIHTCQIQIASVSHKNQGKITTVQAYVTVEVPEDQLTVTNSKLKNKQPRSLLAIYEASTNRLQLEIELNKNSDSFVLTTQPFEYQLSSIGKPIDFKSADLSDYGTVRIDSTNDLTVLVHEFKVDGDNLILRIGEDHGLFQFQAGKNGVSSGRSF